MQEKPSSATMPNRKWHRFWPWINVGIMVLLILAGFWLLAVTIGLVNIWNALLLANGRFMFLAFCIMVANGLTKAWRWGLLLKSSEQKIPYPPLYWATMLGQYVNMLLPLFRLGEIARAYAIDTQTQIGKVRALSTMVVEKTLDVIMLGIVLTIILPFVILPDSFSQNWGIVALLGTAVLAGLYLLAYQTEFVSRVFVGMTQWLPDKIRDKLVPLIVSGLEGVSALRSRHTSLLLIGSSAIIQLLAVLTPMVLFWAFALPLGLTDAALLDSALTFTAAPPSTPGQIGVFEATVTVVLSQLGKFDGAILISYAIVYHLIVLIPKIIFGGLAALRTNWKWQQSDES